MRVRILLHVCCGPCAIVPLRELLGEGHSVAAWFYNPNIHPLAEFLRRREGAERVAAAHGVDILFPPETGTEYDIAAWCRDALASGTERCVRCREMRFDAAARATRERGFDAFTSSLLYSRRQDHEGMRNAGEKSSAAYAVSFLYRDFRPRWQEGVIASRELGIYRQRYCGCIFSEEERYGNELRRAQIR